MPAPLRIPWPIAHDQICTRTQLFDEALEIGEIVAIVGIAHDDETAPGLDKAASQSVAVTFERVINDSGTGIGGNLNALVGRAIIDNDHFARDAEFAHRPNR